MEQKMAQSQKKRWRTRSGTNQNMVPGCTNQTRPAKSQPNATRNNNTIHNRTQLPIKTSKILQKNDQMDLTCRLCQKPNIKEDSIHIWSTCNSQEIQTSRKGAIAQSRLRVRKAPSSKAPARLANSLINFTNFVWSKYELYQFLRNASVMLLMYDYKGEQTVTR